MANLMARKVLRVYILRHYSVNANISEIHEKADKEHTCFAFNVLYLLFIFVYNTAIDNLD